MPQANEWSPEDGDREWWPDPDRSVTSYSDTELRFLPVYRTVRAVSPFELSDQEALACCREVIAGFLADDDPDPLPETPQLRLVP